MIDSSELIRIQAESHHRGGSMSRAWPLAQAMGAEELEGFLVSQSFCVLATAGSRQRALARPVAFVVVGASLWVASGDGARLRHLRESGWASAALIEGGRGAHRGVLFDGPVRLTEQAPPGVSDAYREIHGDPAGWTSTWCELSPATLYSYAGAPNV